MELFQAFSVQTRIIKALILLETKSRYGNSKLGFFWALFEPAAHVGVFMALFSALGRSPPLGDSTALFILTGIIPWVLYNNTVNKVMASLNTSKALLGYPQVMPMDIAVSRVILEFASLFIVMLFFLSIAVYTGLTIKIDSFLNIMAPTGLFILLAMGVGLINCAILQTTPAYANIYSATSRPLYFVSGIFFTANFLSPEAYSILKYNPLLHLIEWFRSGFYPNFNGALYDKNYVITFVLVVFTMGLMAERATRKKARIA